MMAKLGYIKGYVALFGSKLLLQGFKAIFFPFVCEKLSKVHGAVGLEAEEQKMSSFNF